jgi:hypothetical protein
MSFYRELLPFIDQIHSIRKLENYFSFDMKFPEKWSMPKSLVEESQVVAFQTEEQNTKGISFVCQIDEKEVTSTLNRITKIIKLNKERELKEKLFKQTIEQLKQTFEKTDLDKLKNLYFDFDEGDEEPNLEIDEQDGDEPAITELAE